MHNKRFVLTYDLRGDEDAQVHQLRMLAITLITQAEMLAKMTTGYEGTVSDPKSGEQQGTFKMEMESDRISRQIMLDRLKSE